MSLWPNSSCLLEPIVATKSVLQFEAETGTLYAIPTWEVTMNQPQSRREFLADVGKGTLLATIGPALAAEFGITTHAAAGEAMALNFGDMESLVCFMQETPVSKLQPALAAKLKEGMPLKKLVAAGVLANARNFGGEDYIGFHTLMALHPALNMAASMPDRQAALPVFKVLYRNTNRIQEFGGRGDTKP